MLVLSLAVGCASTQSVSDATTVAPAQEPPAPADPLASWNDTATKQAVVAFVRRVTDPNSTDFVPEAERIAVFDNDGTLWIEQPVYTQLAFALDRIRQLAPQHPEWKTTQPFQAVLEGDKKALKEAGEEGLVQILMATHAGMTTTEFQEAVAAWLQTATHPKLDRPYIQMVYQPMLELLAFLRDNGFQTYIVSGGGVEFMRVFAEGVYGIPPEQVIGTSVVTKYEMKDGQPVIARYPELFFLDDKVGKPVAIQRVIGRRPTMAFGNSDGDFEMLEWTASGDGARLGAFVHHTDGVREYLYDRGSKVGSLEKGLDAAAANKWLLIDMKKDWKVVFPASPPAQ